MRATDEATMPARSTNSKSPAVSIAGRYRLIRKLGSGGMGEVWAVRDQLIGRHFALKLLREDIAQRSSAIEQFRREARTAARLESEHIVAVLGFGGHLENIPYMLMELLSGVDLRRLLHTEGLLSPERTARIGIQVCRGLAVAHAAGVVHRDLKPSNLFLCPRWDGIEQVKILDFGVAKLLSDGDSSTLSGAGVVGTVNYMSPEQARGERLIDQRADLYALGALLYEALCGQPPHPGENSNLVLQHIVFRRPRPLQQENPELPAELCAAIDRALAHDPMHRFQSAEELAEALTRFLKRPSYGSPTGTRARTSSRSAPVVRSLILGLSLTAVFSTNVDSPIRSAAVTQLPTVAPCSVAIHPIPNIAAATSESPTAGEPRPPDVPREVTAHVARRRRASGQPPTNSAQFDLKNPYEER